MVKLFVPQRKSYRSNKLAETIRAILSEMFIRGDLPPRFLHGSEKTLPSPLTVTQVRVSPDLKHAYVSVMPLGGQFTEETLAYLTNIQDFLWHRLREQLHLRKAPRLAFRIDNIFESSKRIEDLMNRVHTSTPSSPMQE